jgi:hypothetical protein
MGPKPLEPGDSMLELLGQKHCDCLFETGGGMRHKLDKLRIRGTLPKEVK